MKILYKYTSKNMSGWEFLLLQDNGTDGYYVTGNTASTAINYGANDMTIIVSTKKQLKDIAERLEWLGKYSNHGEQ